MFLILFAVACGGGGKSPADSVAGNDSQPSTGGDSSPNGDSGGQTGETGETGLPSGLIGVAPDEPVPAPEFVATNYDNTLRDRDALLGHPTVMWFYPAAGTSG